MGKLDDLEALLTAATPGPWVRCHDTVVLAEDGFTTVCGVSSDDIGTGYDIAAIAALRNIASKLIAVARAAKELEQAHYREDMAISGMSVSQAVDDLVKALAALEEP